MKKIIIAMMIVLLGISITQVAFAKSKVKKKIVMVKDDDGEFFTAVSGLIGKLLIEKGYTKENSEYTVLSVEGKPEKVPEVLEKIKEIKPDAVLINTTMLSQIGLGLKDTNIPVIVGGGMEKEDENGKRMLIDSKGNPKYNITGTYTTPNNYIERVTILMDRIKPLKKKKVVFITLKGDFTEKRVKASFAKSTLKLKQFHEVNYFEEFQELILQYNEDKEVGWIMIGETPKFTETGSISTEDCFKWERENNKKPSASFWENTVASGVLCGLTIDSMTTVEQMINMTDRILMGEKVKNVKPEDPIKLLIVLNGQRAKDLGIDLTRELLDIIWKAYIDYNGNYLDGYFERLYKKALKTKKEKELQERKEKMEQK